MHTKQFIDEDGFTWTVHHNGDWSGNLVFNIPEAHFEKIPMIDVDKGRYFSVEIPASIFDMMKDSKVADEMISYLEQNYG